MEKQTLTEKTNPLQNAQENSDEKIKRKLKEKLEAFALFGAYDGKYDIHIIAPIGEMHKPIWREIDFERLGWLYLDHQDSVYHAHGQRILEMFEFTRLHAHSSESNHLFKYKEAGGSEYLWSTLPERGERPDLEWLADFRQTLERFGYKKEEKKIQFKQTFSLKEAKNEATKFIAIVFAEFKETREFLEKDLERRITQARKEIFEENETEK